MQGKVNLKSNQGMDLEKELKEAIKHDIHKVHGRKHVSAYKLSTSADGDASLMSRPKRFKIVFGNDVDNYRYSMIDGNWLFEPYQNIPEQIEDKYSKLEPAESMYLKLLNCNLLSRYNESPELSLTSLKYHTILVTNLQYNYLNGHKFIDLYFGIMDTDKVSNIFETIYMDKESKKSFVITSITDGLDAYTKIGYKGLNFGNVLSRLNYSAYDDWIWSNVRRVHSWSIGLQYLEDVLIKNRGSL